MRSINLYSLMVDLDEELLALYEKSLSGRNKVLKIRKDELVTLKRLVKVFENIEAKESIFDGWFYSFSIPHIPKEFDLLKIDNDSSTVVNIELKSEQVSTEKIQRQLVRNKTYLNMIAKNVYAYTFMLIGENDYKIYCLDNENLIEINIYELQKIIANVKKIFQGDINMLFKARDFLISPINTPKKFLKKKYFLTSNQEEIKKELLEKTINYGGIYGVTGEAGTGKTLLLYDFANELCKLRYKVCVVHCGKLSDGHKYLNKQIENMNIIPAKYVGDISDEYDFIFIDEAQRIYNKDFKKLLNTINAGLCVACIFFYDPKQYLSELERKRNIRQRLNAIDGYLEKKLSNKIRLSDELYAFINLMIRGEEKYSKDIIFENISIFYANDNEKAFKLLNALIRNGYEFITYTPSKYYRNSIDYYQGYENTHDVIGQEFDNVVIILDNNFYYSDNGQLLAREHPNPDYLFPKLFYQNITRAREKLAIVVVNNKKLFKRLLELKTKKND